jgi:hypothetical protein
MEHHAFGPEFRCFLLNFPDASGELKPMELVLDTGEYQRLREKKLALKREICVRRQQMVDCDRWLTGDAASAHAVIAKKTKELQSLLEYTECRTKMCDSLNLDNHGARLRKYTCKKNHKSEKKKP